MITFVNVFTVLPEKQEDAFKNIEKVYTDVVKYQPGFIDAKLHRSDDGLRVTAVAHWESEENLKALRETPGFKALHDENFYNAIVSNDGHIYSTVVSVEPQQ